MAAQATAFFMADGIEHEDIWCIGIRNSLSRSINGLFGCINDLQDNGTDNRE